MFTTFESYVVISVLVLVIVLTSAHNILTLLLSLEAFVLLAIGIYTLTGSSLVISTILVILSLAACESSLALSIIASIVRYSGSDQINTNPY